MTYQFSRYIKTVSRDQKEIEKKLTTIYQGNFKSVRRDIIKAIDKTMKTIKKEIFRFLCMFPKFFILYNTSKSRLTCFDNNKTGRKLNTFG